MCIDRQLFHATPAVSPARMWPSPLLVFAPAGRMRPHEGLLRSVFEWACAQKQPPWL
jgi:hypothetical protein